MSDRGLEETARREAEGAVASDVAPFLIWTFRRTGGTSLATLLAKVSAHPGCKHEPFNHERPFHWVLAEFEATGDEDALRRNVATVLEPRPNLKHCYDFLPFELHEAVLEVAKGLGYRHVVLDRREDLDRVLSLELAQQTGVWGPDHARDLYPDFLAGRMALAPLSERAVVSQMTSGQERRAWLARRLAEEGIAPHVVLFEDVFRSEADGAREVAGLFAYIGQDPAANPKYPELLDQALTKTSQNSARLLEVVPGIDDLRAALARRDFGRHPWVDAASGGFSTS